MTNALRPSIVLLIALTGLASVSTHAQNRIGTGDVDQLYKQYCASCHGNNLEGGSGGSFLDDEWKHGSSDEAMARVIREGVPDTEMVPWGTVLSDEQIRSLVIYIREKRQMVDRDKLLQRLQPKGGVFEADGHKFRLEKVAEIDGILWSIAFLPDGTPLVTERDGKLWLITDGKPVGPIKGIPEVWQHGQGGLLEVAPHPDYEENGWIYLSYSENIGAKERDRKAGMTAVVRGRIVNGAWVDQEEIFHVPGEFHTSAGVHFGSRFVFKDGYLFFSIGDRGRQNMAQDLTRPNGKIHRIHDDGRVPDDNPFVHIENAYPTIWCYGNRNPQGLDLDPATGELWESEHGPRGGDEINLIKPHRNYGWPTITYGMNYNGKPITDKTASPGMEQPKHYWTPSIAVCGIDFYEGDAFPKWKGNLFVGGMASEELHRLVIKDNQVVEDSIVMKNQGRVRDVASGPDGNLYVSLSRGGRSDGALFRLVPAD